MIKRGTDLWDDYRPQAWVIKRARKEGIDLKPGYSAFLWKYLKDKRHHHGKAMGARTGTPVEARINHSRWIADCPYCIHAEMVDPDNKKFFCLNCGMEHNGHRPLPVKFPPKAQRLEIERLLSIRPLEANRNWFPYETVQDIRQENIDYGLEV